MCPKISVGDSGVSSDISCNTGFQRPGSLVVRANVLLLPFIVFRNIQLYKHIIGNKCPKVNGCFVFLLFNHRNPVQNIPGLQRMQVCL